MKASYLCCMVTLKNHEKSMIKRGKHWSYEARILQWRKYIGYTNTYLIHIRYFFWYSQTWRIVCTVLNIGRYTDISTDKPVFYPKRYDKCKILSDIVLDRYGLISRHVVYVSTDIRDENVRCIVTWHIWGASTNAFEEFLQKISILYEFMTINLL